MNGVVIIDKPPGKTSHDVVMDVKKTLGVRKAGHTGTLDPLATGVLPVCINEATKLVPFLTTDTKEYRVTMQLGIKTDTLDIEGEIIAHIDPPRMGLNEIRDAFNHFVGRIQQTPPQYSAVKFCGKPLYKWARSGVSIMPNPRTVEIYRIDVLEIKMPYVTFTVSCSKGTYIRSLCADVGDLLGCGACLTALRRMRSGRFCEDKAVSLHEVDARNVIAMRDVLPDFPVFPVDYTVAGKLRMGYQPLIEAFDLYHIPFVTAGEVIMLTDERNRLVAIAGMLYASDQFGELDRKEQAMKIMRVFHSES
jgi:tRNA pseudouridine55 synthase